MIKSSKKVRSLSKKLKKKKDFYLELEGERRENNSALFLKDFSDVVAGGCSHR